MCAGAMKSTRRASTRPMAAPDAIVVDSTESSIEEVLVGVKGLVARKGG